MDFQAVIDSLPRYAKPLLVTYLSKARSPRELARNSSPEIDALYDKFNAALTEAARGKAAAFLEKTSPTFETHRLQRFIRDFANPFDAEGAPHVLSISIQGPFNAKGAETPPSPRVFACKPASGLWSVTLSRI